MGLSNTAGTLPGVIGVAVTGYILEATGSGRWCLACGQPVRRGCDCLAHLLTGERIFD